ncbi:MAG: FKBP-type peptidyl-prolyl cis-trans isomerase [Lachnospiraceae bacterium]|nr:FKBP-type peptidyl-prolyl cis-trans isomerase [Lachnospiraceae bacterium]
MRARFLHAVTRRGIIMSEELKNETVTEVAADVNEANSVSKSKQKREARKAEVKSEKVKKGFDRALAWVIGVLIAVIVVGAIGMGIYTQVSKTTAADNYSLGLDDNGFISGADTSKAKDLGLETLKVSLSDIEYSDDEIDAKIGSLLNAKADFSEDTSLEVKDGDTINLDYVGSIDGVEFEGGSTGGNGTTLTIGSHTYIDNFEEQLIGSHPGDSVKVEVSFPEEYPNNPDLAGKPAVFDCVVNSVKVIPELTDEFVKENYSEYGSTTEELREAIRKDGREANLQTYLSKYIDDNAEASVPGKYIKALKSVTKYDDTQQFDYMNQMSANYYGSKMYETFEDFTGKTDAEYEKDLSERAKKMAASSLTYEAFYKNNNLNCDEEYANILEMIGGEENIAQYGVGYLKQIAIRNTVLNHLRDVVTVE